MNVLLADALLRRKELSQKVEQVKAVKAAGVFELRTERRKAHEGIDDIVANVPKLTLSQVTAEYDYYAGALRRLDSAIQQANWTVNIAVDDKCMIPWAEANPQPKA